MTGMPMAAFWHDSEAYETIPLTGVKQTALLRRGNACNCRVGPGNFTPSLSQIRT